MHPEYQDQKRSIYIIILTVYCKKIFVYYLSGDCLTKCILPDCLSFILHGTNHQIRIFCKGISCFFYIIQIPQIFIKFRQAGAKPRYYSQYKFPCTECLLVSLNEPEPDLTSIMLSLCDLYQASQQMPDLLSHNPGVSNCCWCLVKHINEMCFIIS